MSTCSRVAITLSEFLEFVLRTTSDHEERILELEMRAGIRRNHSPVA